MRCGCASRWLLGAGPKAELSEPTQEAFHLPSPVAASTEWQLAIFVRFRNQRIEARQIRAQHNKSRATYPSGVHSEAQIVFGF